MQAKPIYRSELEALAKDNSEYCSKGGLTKKVLQRHSWCQNGDYQNSITKNSTQLHNGLRNRPPHVFGDHTNCSKETSAHFSRIHLLLSIKELRKINPQCPQLQNRPLKNRLAPSYRLKQSCRSLHMMNMMLPRVGIHP